MWHGRSERKKEEEAEERKSEKRERGKWKEGRGKRKEGTGGPGPALCEASVP